MPEKKKIKGFGKPVNKCSGKECAGTGFIWDWCQRKPIIKINDEWYCALHNPERLSKKN